MLGKTLVKYIKEGKESLEHYTPLYLTYTPTVI